MFCRQPQCQPPNEGAGVFSEAAPGSRFNPSVIADRGRSGGHRESLGYLPSPRLLSTACPPINGALPSRREDYGPPVPPFHGPPPLQRHHPPPMRHSEMAAGPSRAFSGGQQPLPISVPVARHGRNFELPPRVYYSQYPGHPHVAHSELPYDNRQPMYPHPSTNSPVNLQINFHSQTNHQTVLPYQQFNNLASSDNIVAMEESLTSLLRDIVSRIVNSTNAGQRAMLERERARVQAQIIELKVRPYDLKILAAQDKDERAFWIAERGRLMSRLERSETWGPSPDSAVNFRRGAGASLPLGAGERVPNCPSNTSLDMVSSPSLQRIPLRVKPSHPTPPQPPPPVCDGNDSSLSSLDLLAAVAGATLPESGTTNDPVPTQHQTGTPSKDKAANGCNYSPVQDASTTSMDMSSFNRLLRAAADTFEGADKVMDSAEVESDDDSKVGNLTVPSAGRSLAPPTPKQSKSPAALANPASKSKKRSRASDSSKSKKSAEKSRAEVVVSEATPAPPKQTQTSSEHAPKTIIKGTPIPVPPAALAKPNKSKKKSSASSTARDSAKAKVTRKANGRAPAASTPKTKTSESPSPSQPNQQQKLFGTTRKTMTSMLAAVEAATASATVGSAPAVGNHETSHKEQGHSGRSSAETARDAQAGEGDVAAASQDARVNCGETTKDDATATRQDEVKKRGRKRKRSSKGNDGQPSSSRTGLQLSGTGKPSAVTVPSPPLSQASSLLTSTLSPRKRLKLNSPDGEADRPTSGMKEVSSGSDAIFAGRAALPCAMSSPGRALSHSPPQSKSTQRAKTRGSAGGNLQSVNLDAASSPKMMKHEASAADAMAQDVSEGRRFEILLSDQPTEAAAVEESVESRVRNRALANGNADPVGCTHNAGGRKGDGDFEADTESLNSSDTERLSETDLEVGKPFDSFCIELPMFAKLSPRANRRASSVTTPGPAEAKSSEVSQTEDSERARHGLARNNTKGWANSASSGSRSASQSRTSPMSSDNEPEVNANGFARACNVALRKEAIGFAAGAKNQRCRSFGFPSDLSNPCTSLPFADPSPPVRQSVEGHSTEADIFENFFSDDDLCPSPAPANGERSGIDWGGLTLNKKRRKRASSTGKQRFGLRIGSDEIAACWGSAIKRSSQSVRHTEASAERVGSGHRGDVKSVRASWSSDPGRERVAVLKSDTICGANDGRNDGTGAGRDGDEDDDDDDDEFPDPGIFIDLTRQRPIWTSP
ncbi:hypothetical protein DFJ73DRAFT_798777, partial [Zopfochytrium polystomum]